MASKALTTIAFLLTLNLLFLTLVTSTKTPKSCPPPPKPPTPTPCPPPPKPPATTPPPKKTPPPSNPPKKATPPPPKPPTTTPCPPPPTKTTPPSNPPTKATCPKDTLKLGVCANLLNGLLPIVIGNPSNTPCCSLIGGLADLDAAVCLCTAIKANVLGINLNVPVSLSVLLNYCGKKAPSGFQCA